MPLKDPAPLVLVAQGDHQYLVVVQQVLVPRRAMPVNYMVAAVVAAATLAAVAEDRVVQVRQEL